MTDDGMVVIEAKASMLPQPAAASTSGVGVQPTDQGPRQTPTIASPRPDGTIVLSSSVDAKLQKYLGQNPRGASYFYVSKDGQSADAYGAGRVRTVELGFDQATAALRAKARAKSDCEVGSATECVMLFHQASARQPYAKL